MRHYGSRRRTTRRNTGNTVIHVPSSIGATLAPAVSVVIVIVSPSIFAAGSASSNIEAQDKDRTVNVGHHVGRLNISIGLRGTTGVGVMEASVFKVERAESTPALGVHPIPSSSENASQGMQQAVRLANPGKTFHWSQTPYALDNNKVKNIIVSPAKYKLSKLKAGDHWILMIHNRGSATFNFDIQMRYKEYE